MPYLDEDADAREAPEHVPRVEDHEQGIEKGVEAVKGELKELEAQLDRDLIKIENDQSPEAQALRAGLLALKTETDSAFKQFWKDIAGALGSLVEFTKRWFEARHEKQLQIPDNKKIIETMQNRLDSLRYRHFEFAMKQKKHSWQTTLPRSMVKEVERMVAEYARANKKDETKWTRVADSLNQLISAHVKGLLETKTSDPHFLTEAVGWTRLLIPPDKGHYLSYYDDVRERVQSALVTDFLNEVPSEARWNKKDKAISKLSNTYPDLFPLQMYSSKEEFTQDQIEEKIRRFFEVNHPRELSRIRLNEFPASTQRFFTPAQRKQLFEAYLAYQPTDAHNLILYRHDFFFDQIRQASKEQIDQILHTILVNNANDYNRQWYYGILFSIIPLDVESAQEFFPPDRTASDGVWINIMKLRNPEIYPLDPHARRERFAHVMNMLTKADDLVALVMVYAHPEMYGITQDVVEREKWNAIERYLIGTKELWIGQRIYQIRDLMNGLAMNAKEIDRLRHFFVRHHKNSYQEVGVFIQDTRQDGGEDLETLGKLFGLPIKNRDALRDGIYLSFAKEATKYNEVKDLYKYFLKHSGHEEVIQEMLNHFTASAPIEELEKFFESEKNLGRDLDLSVLTMKQHTQLFSRLMDGDSRVFLRNDIQRRVFADFSLDTWRNYLKRVAPTLPNFWSSMVLFKSESSFFMRSLMRMQRHAGRSWRHFFPHLCLGTLWKLLNKKSQSYALHARNRSFF